MRLTLGFLFLLGCGDAIAPAAIDDAGDEVTELEADAGLSTGADGSAFVDATLGTDCTKQLTVLFAVGTGAGALSSHAGDCWTVLDADGSANKSFRKCSTGTWTVSNSSAPNYAFDDTNPNAALSQDQSFMTTCSTGATGDGFEYMAYRGSWRLLYPANHLRAFFAELYVGDGDVDDYWPSAYVGNSQLAKHTVYPMINIGPTNVSSPAGKIKTDSLAICKTIKSGGYFGVYVGTWDQPMDKNDARIVALASALDTCTKK